MAVDVEIGPDFRVGSPRSVMTVARRIGTAFPYDVSPDGSRILWNVQVGGTVESPPVTIVRNWPALLDGQR